MTTLTKQEEAQYNEIIAKFGTLEAWLQDTLDFQKKILSEEFKPLRDELFNELNEVA